MKKIIKGWEVVAVQRELEEERHLCSRTQNSMHL